MPRSIIQQQRFTQGELDPEMLARSDIDAYRGATLRALNVFPLPQGGLIRSPGLAYIDNVLKRVSRVSVGITITTPNGGTGANANDDDNATELTTVTDIGSINPYIVVHYDLSSVQDIGYIRLSGIRCSAGTVDNVYIQTSTDNITWVNASSPLTLATNDQSLTVRVKSNIRYIRVARIAGSALPSITITLDELEAWIQGSIGNVKLINFEFNTQLTYLLVVTEFNIAVYKNDVYQVDVYAPYLTNAKIPKLDWTQDANTLILVEENLQPQKVVRGGDTNWTIEPISFDFIPKFDYDPSTSNPSANITPDDTTGTVVITASSGIFSSAYINQVIEGNGGRARIVKYTSNTKVVAFMEIPFYSTDTISSGSWTLLSGFVSVWGGGKGWPRSTTFSEGRLWFGGSLSRPRTIWGSRINLPFNFDAGTALDNDAVIVDVAGSNNELNTIVAIYGGRALQVFTTGSTYAFVKGGGEAITPSNGAIVPQVNVGAEDGIQLAEIEGVVYYVQRGGNSVHGLLFSDTVNAYDAIISSKLSSHLIKQPSAMALRKATSTDDGAYLALVNNDGNMTIANISNAEGIQAYVERNTNGSFVTTGAVFNALYVVVNREINGEIVQLLEKYSFDNIFDSSIKITSGLPSATIAGLEHLEGATVNVRADDVNLPDAIVSNGSITLPQTANNYVEIGFNFIPIVKDLPIPTQDGMARAGVKKRVSQIHIRVHETSSLQINKNDINFNKLNRVSKNSAITPYTGVVSVYGNRGWSENGTITLTQKTAGSMQILSISKKVNT